MMRFLLFVLSATFCFASVAVAGIYKWTDDQGGVHYTDDRKKIPAAYRDRAVDLDQVEGGGSVTYNPKLGVSSPQEEGQEPFYKRYLRELEAERIQKAEATRQPHVTLYMTDW